MMWTHWILDLDNTLYSAQTGVFDRVDVRIQQYLMDRLGWSEGRARAFRLHCIQHFGTTLRGLRIYYPELDPLEFLEYAHDVPLEDLLGPMPEVRSVLAALPGMRVIFSNSDRKHTARVLDLLGLSDLFEVCITIEDLGFIPKPHWEAYAMLVERLRAIPSRCVYVDDLLENLRMARRWGFRCVWVTHRTSSGRSPEPGIVAIPTVLDLPRAVAWL